MKYCPECGLKLVEEESRALECAICNDKGFPFYAQLNGKIICRDCVLKAHGRVNGWPPG